MLALQIVVNGSQMFAHGIFGGAGIALHDRGHDVIMLSGNLAAAGMGKRALPRNAPVGPPQRCGRQIVHCQQENIIGTSGNGAVEGEIRIFEATRCIRLGRDCRLFTDVPDLLARGSQGTEPRQNRLKLDPHFHHISRTRIRSLLEEVFSHGRINGRKKSSLSLPAPNDAFGFEFA